MLVHRAQDKKMDLRTVSCYSCQLTVKDMVSGRHRRQSVKNLRKEPKTSTRFFLFFLMILLVISGAAATLHPVRGPKEHQEVRQGLLIYIYIYIYNNSIESIAPP